MQQSPQTPPPCQEGSAEEPLYRGSQCSLCGLPTSDPQSQIQDEI